MNDKELIELAAKAAGIPFNWIKDWAGNEGVGTDGTEHGCTIWNPLTDDGDALRLAVKLELDVFHSCISVRAIHRENDRGWSIRCRGTKPQMDPYAATRRAIVRAAAEIGKGMK